jgi:hypothetical protein
MELLSTNNLTTNNENTSKMNAQTKQVHDELLGNLSAVTARNVTMHTVNTLEEAIKRMKEESDKAQTLEERVWIQRTIIAYQRILLNVRYAEWNLEASLMKLWTR